MILWRNNTFGKFLYKGGYNYVKRFCEQKKMNIFLVLKIRGGSDEECKMIQVFSEGKFLTGKHKISKSSLAVNYKQKKLEKFKVFSDEESPLLYCS